ncbi:exonuclease domain-containing protein [Pseudomonadota bacterium]
MFRRWRHRKKCRALARQSTREVLSEYSSECANLKLDSLVNTPLISVDLELTGLDAKQNQIIAIGWTQIDHGRMRFSSNRHLLTNAEQSVGHSAAIHELLDSDVAAGIPLGNGLQALFEAARGRVWLFHHANLDVAFLKQACISWGSVAPPFIVLDTLRMELMLRKRREIPVQQGDLRLSDLRASYHLPRYTAHNALIDACATAELLLAIAGRMEPSGSLKLSPYIRYF